MDRDQSSPGRPTQSPRRGRRAAVHALGGLAALAALATLAALPEPLPGTSPGDDLTRRTAARHKKAAARDKKVPLGT